MSKSTLSIFNTAKAEDALTVARETLSVVQNDQGEICVGFTTNRGKGSGLQMVPFTEFPAFVQELARIANEGIPEQGAKSAVDMLRQTIANEDGILSFRASSGKGAKPARVAEGQLAAVAKMLEKAIPAIQAAIDDFNNIS